MATLYAKAAGGNWSSAGTWSNVSSAGSDSSGPPTSADDAILNSGSGNVTVDVTNSSCRSLDCNGYTGTFNIPQGINLGIGTTTPGAGNIAMRLSASMTFSYGPTTAFIVFGSTSATQQTIDGSGKSLCNISIAGTGSNYQFANDVIINTANAFAYSATSATLDANSKTIFMSLSNGARTFTGGGKTYYGLTVTNTNSTFTITGNNTFTNLSISTTSGNTTTVLASSTTVTGTLTFAGAGTARQLVTSSTIGTQSTITNTGATMTWSYVDFRDIALSSSFNASAITGLSGDCGGNSNITFTTAATQTATGTASFTWSTHGWTSRVPLPQDDVSIPNAFVAGRTINCDVPRIGKNITCSCTGSPTIAFSGGSNGTTVFGSLNLTGIGSQSLANGVIFEGRSSYTLTSAGTTFPNTTNISMVGGTLTLADAYTNTTGNLVLNNGTFDANGFNVTVSGVTNSSTNTRTLNLGSGIWTLTGTGGIWNPTVTGLTFNAGTSTIIVSNVTTSSKTFTGGGLSYNNFTASGDNITVSSTSTYNVFAINNAGLPTGLKLTFTGTQTVNSISTNGSYGNLAILSSGTSGTAATIVKSASGIFSTDYMSIQDITLSTTNTPTWFAGLHSVNVSNNSSNIKFTNQMVYVRSTTGSDSNNGLTWATAKATLSGAFSAMFPGDVAYLSQSHSESNPSGALNLASPGTAFNPCYVLCVNDAGSVPPVSTDLTTGAVVYGLTNASVIFTGFCYVNGVNFSSGSTASSSNFTFGVGTGSWWWKFENSQLAIGSSNSTSRINVGLSANSTSDEYLELNNTTLLFGNISQGIVIKCPFKWTNTNSAIAGITFPTTLFLTPTSGNSGYTDIRNVDFSALGSGKNLIDAGQGTTSKYSIQNCKFGSGLNISTGTPPGQGAIALTVLNCDSADTNYQYYKQRFQGAITNEITVVNTNGATNGTTKLSRKMTSTANSTYYSPLESDAMVMWIESPGSAFTATVEIVNDGSTLTDGDIWLEIEYSSDSLSPQYSIISDAKSNYLSSGSNQASSAVSWTTTGLTSPITQKLEVTFTPLNKGLVYGRVMLAKPSQTVYFDPKMKIV